MTKRFKAKRFFSVITKNWNSGISAKNSVTFKIKDGVMDEKFKYFGCLLKNSTKGGFSKKKYKRGDCLKGGRALIDLRR